MNLIWWKTNDLRPPRTPVVTTCSTRSAAGKATWRVLESGDAQSGAIDLAGVLVTYARVAGRGAVSRPLDEGRLAPYLRSWAAVPAPAQREGFALEPRAYRDVPSSKSTVDRMPGCCRRQPNPQFAPP